MRFLFPLLIKSHTPKFVYYEKDSNSRHLTALDDETFSEKKENKKTSRDQKKEKAPLKFYSQLKRTKKEREIRERKRKI
jgi:hypothetical protein